MSVTIKRGGSKNRKKRNNHNLAEQSKREVWPCCGTRSRAATSIPGSGWHLAVYSQLVRVLYNVVPGPCTVALSVLTPGTVILHLVPETWHCILHVVGTVPGTWYCTPTYMVQDWYPPGLYMVQDWYPPGLYMVQYWYTHLVLYMVLYKTGTPTWYCTWYKTGTVLGTYSKCIFFMSCNFFRKPCPQSSAIIGGVLWCHHWGGCYCTLYHCKLLSVNFLSPTFFLSHCFGLNFCITKKQRIVRNMTGPKKWQGRYEKNERARTQPNKWEGWDGTKKKMRGMVRKKFRRDGTKKVRGTGRDKKWEGRMTKKIRWTKRKPKNETDETERKIKIKRMRMGQKSQNG